MSCNARNGMPIESALVHLKGSAKETLDNIDLPTRRDIL
jgi:hypothetical protein